jgi:hypothetical protein
MRNTALVLALIVLAVLLASAAAILSAQPGAGQTATATLVGAGDIASCHYSQDGATARLLGRIPGTVFTLGDNVYPAGTLKQFLNCYKPTWGKYKRRTRPTAGNHDYQTEGARGYFDYFGARAGRPSRGYYSYERGSWHVVVLNSNCDRDRVGGCGRRSPQGRWLRNNLNDHQARCTIAYFHHPLYSSGEHGNSAYVRPFWKALYRANADVVLSGHDHDYERFAPQDPYGTLDREGGIREFVVGTGGTHLRPFGTIRPHSRVRNATTNGVLKLRLYADGYRWKFVPVAGKTFTDSGTGACH